MSKRTTRQPAPPQHYSARLVTLRTLLETDAAAAGDQAVKLLEEYLESLAHAYGYHGEGSMGRYVMFLRGRDALPDQLLDQADGYTQVRNCLAHTYGLQVSPDLAAELLDFAGLLLKQGGVTAEQLMTRNVRVVAASERLARARDLMLAGGYGRLPVLRDGDGIIGLLTERDVVFAQAEAERAGRTLSALSVADALPADALTRVVFAPPHTARDTIVELLQRRGVVACLVTSDGSADKQPLGIITAADLLYRM
jgi:CBS domain-containing protein